MTKLAITHVIRITVFGGVGPRAILPCDLALATVNFYFLVFSPKFTHTTINVILMNVKLSTACPIVLDVLKDQCPSLSKATFDITLTVTLINRATVGNLVNVVSRCTGNVKLCPCLVVTSLTIVLLLCGHSLGWVCWLLGGRGDCIDAQVIGRYP